MWAMPTRQSLFSTVVRGQNPQEPSFNLLETSFGDFEMD